MADAIYRKHNKLDKGRPRSLKDSFTKTNLDLENPKVSGGPNRTNSSNIPSGQYQTSIPGNYPWQAPAPGGTLRDKEGNIVTTQLQRWTKDNKYLDSFDGDGNQNL